jgi:hypothetical protein
LEEGIFSCRDGFDELSTEGTSFPLIYKKMI